MFLKSRPFEQSLRAGISPAVPAQPGSSLNPAFHKGCTGKAHACGTKKSQKPPPTNSSQPNPTMHLEPECQLSETPNATATPLRKNSISSEAVSDSSSENSSAPEILTIQANVLKTPKTKQQGVPSLVYKKLKDVSSCANVKAVPRSPESTRALPRVASMDVASPTMTRRIRMHSEGENDSISSSPSNAHSSNFERTLKYRSVRVVGERQPKTTQQRPPWNSAAARPSANNSPLQQINRVLRTSLRRQREIVQWPAVWKHSLVKRGSISTNCVYKNYDDKIKKKP